jgi:hypothetical protein
MPNTENINRLIALIKADNGEHFLMSSFINYLPHANFDQDKEPIRYIECGTACCLAGWANTIIMTDSGIDLKNLVGDRLEEEITNDRRAEKWLGIRTNQALELFFPFGKMISIDKLPSRARAAAGIRVLEILREENRVDWDAAISYAKESTNV